MATLDPATALRPTRRVVITGLGAVTPIGNSPAEFWQSLLAGRSGIGPITHFDASRHDCRIAGEVKGFDPLDYLDRKDVKRTDRFVHWRWRPPGKPWRRDFRITLSR
jgi:3-oxoacyl-[acyl-carrier-protein] synthase II (EC 2.3.1.41)